jgi:hypothetical protein
MRVEQRGETWVLLCSCCNLAFAKLQFGRIVIQSKHHSEHHTNAISSEDLQKILDELRKDADRIRSVPRH